MTMTLTTTMMMWKRMQPMTVSAHALLATALSLAILAATLWTPPAPRDLGTGLANPAAIAASTPIAAPESLTGGMIPPKDCALYLAGVGLGLLAGAATIAVSAGTATPLVIGLALSGSLLPSASVAC